jgi:hypothetical protein
MSEIASRTTATGGSRACPEEARSAVSKDAASTLRSALRAASGSRSAAAPLRLRCARSALLSTNGSRGWMLKLRALPCSASVHVTGSGDALQLWRRTDRSRHRTASKVKGTGAKENRGQRAGGRARAMPESPRSKVAGVKQAITPTAIQQTKSSSHPAFTGAPQ